jgi:hypothetical protein
MEHLNPSQIAPYVCNIVPLGLSHSLFSSETMQKPAHFSWQWNLLVVFGDLFSSSHVSCFQ